MALPSGRCDKRFRKDVVVELVRPDAPEPKEVALVQNVSARGVRVATQQTWRPGDNVLLCSPESGFQTQARVVYCHRLESNRFAVGLELSTALGEWAKPR
jgi:PilZ domain-containing protein